MADLSVQNKGYIWKKKHNMKIVRFAKVFSGGFELWQSCMKQAPVSWGKPWNYHDAWKKVWVREYTLWFKPLLLRAVERQRDEGCTRYLASCFWDIVSPINFQRLFLLLHEIPYFLGYYALYTERIFEGNNNNITIIAIQNSKINFVGTFGDFSHTVEWNSVKSVWKISLYILAWTSRVEGSNYHTVW